jgi:hypothetical protein
MKNFNNYRKSLNNIGFYVYALCEIRDKVRIPFYIGKGKGGRCLQHFKETKVTEKTKRIKDLLSKSTLGIDILRHDIPSDNTAKLIEATCIDLLGVGELSNAVRGSGKEMGRMTLEEIHSLETQDEIEITQEHRGLAFLLNKSYKSGMTELELFEITRGIWSGVPRNKSLKYAYATYGGIIKEVYEINSWHQAGTQEYFTRSFAHRDISKRWEFVGRKASESIREKYNGKLIKKGRSFGTPFVEVGCQQNNERGS